MLLLFLFYNINLLTLENTWHFNCSNSGKTKKVNESIMPKYLSIILLALLAGWVGVEGGDCNIVENNFTLYSKQYLFLSYLIKVGSK